MFRGSSSHTCDQKGRLIVPSRFREVIEGEKNAEDQKARVMTTVGPVPCLYVYAQSEWDIFEQQLTDSQSPNSSEIRRFFLGNAQECECDRQGRILIPKSLRDYAGIDRDVMLVGMRYRFEIWSLENWNRENEKIIQSFSSGSLKDELAALKV